MYIFFLIAKTNIRSLIMFFKTEKTKTKNASTVSLIIILFLYFDLFQPFHIPHFGDRC